jgi:hypothetical protein
MKDWQDEIADQLDKDYPRWVMEWMSQVHAKSIVQSNDGLRETQRVRRAVIREIVEPVVRAAINARVVEPCKSGEQDEN